MIAIAATNGDDNRTAAITSCQKPYLRNRTLETVKMGRIVHKDASARGLIGCPVEQHVKHG